ncbi:uncharacterized protein EKO05_0003213 [Ascochyta rabiei]|uniref:uncharacterized protein n=1 Tax=Didymella rabiei TaxID=5454 RepID=UPI00190225B2|nr:uncharacterized protein EKO05_0003213 [Ascochyta rabiei]UPX12672.1 hypothetical protein EKO05_0003213 [Ascochyta rabiei]
MRYSIAASGLLGLTAALPQKINIDAALAVPTPTILGPKIEETKPAAISYNPAAAASAVAAIVKSEGAIEKRGVYDVTIEAIIEDRNATMRKRNACDLQPLGNGPSVSPDNAAAFSSATELSRIARTAGTPSGYQQSFMDQSGSSQQIGYLTYKTYQTYDVQGCADACDSEKYCLGFNIFFERDPSLEPGPNCPDPPSTTNIKCSLYGYPVALKAATNMGQWRQDFQVVIAGSNGYSKSNKGLPTVMDFKAPTSLPATINAPLDNGYDTYSGMRLFNDNPFDPALCAAACESQTAYDMAHPDSDGKYKPCNFFTTYILTQNGVPLGTYCAFYTRSWDSSYATNTGYYYGEDKYEVINAGSYEITSPSTGVISSPSSSSSVIVSSSTSVSSVLPSTTLVSSTSSATPSPTFAPFPEGVNVLLNPGFETVSNSGPSTSITNWSGTGGGRVYPVKYQPAAHGGSAYAILQYAGSFNNPTPVMSQSLTAFDTSKAYSLTFYYDLHSIDPSSSCTLSVALGDVNIYTKVLTSNDDPRPYNWKGPITTNPVIPSSHQEALSFRYECTTSGNQLNSYSYIFLDDLNLRSI